MRKIVALTAAAGLIASSCAVGFGLGVAWHSWSRAERWDATALRARFKAAYLEGDPGHETPVFYYQIENATDRDWSVGAESDVRLFVKDEGALDNGWGPGIKIDVPVFVPARDKANLAVHFKMVEKGAPRDSQDEVQRFLRDKGRTWNAYEAFVLIDSRHRYRLELPIGTRGATP